MATNELGHADAVPTSEYGVNDAGPWSNAAQGGAGNDAQGAGAPVVDAASYSYAELVLVDQDTQSGDPGPLGGSTPGSNPLA